MAKEALIWPNVQPVLAKRDEKVLRLLQARDVGWGVTETQSAFVYPHSLRPLRKIAGLQAESPSGNGMNVSDVLQRAFSEEETDLNRGAERNSRGVEAESNKEVSLFWRRDVRTVVQYPDLITHISTIIDDESAFYSRT